MVGYKPKTVSSMEEFLPSKSKDFLFYLLKYFYITTLSRQEYIQCRVKVGKEKKRVLTISIEFQDLVIPEIKIF